MDMLQARAMAKLFFCLVKNVAVVYCIAFNSKVCHEIGDKFQELSSNFRNCDKISLKLKI